MDLIPLSDAELAASWMGRLNGALFTIRREDAQALSALLGRLTNQGPVTAESLIVEPEIPTQSRWIGEAQRIFREYVGEVAFGRVGRALKGLVREHSWPVVKVWWTAYCRDRPYQKRNGAIWGDEPGDGPHNKPPKDVRYVTPEDFIRTFTVWREMCEEVLK